MEMLLLKNFTEPSAITAFAPPLWKLNHSLFGPQSWYSQGQVVGPPVGFELLLIPLDAPEVLSGSAHRQWRRPLPSTGSR